MKMCYCVCMCGNGVKGLMNDEQISMMKKEFF